MAPHVDLTVMETVEEEPKPMVVNVATLKADQRDAAFLRCMRTCCARPT